MSRNLIPRDPENRFRFAIELVIIGLCFAVILANERPENDSAAWSIIGILVASVVRNLARP